jgi:hypothetical protein
MSRCLARSGVVVLAVTAALLASSVATAAARTKCPSPSGGVPASGSTVSGGLEVDGACALNDVTVSGGIVVDSNGGLGFVHSFASGGITVNGGELDINHQLAGASQVGTGGQVTGGIVMTLPSDFDIWSDTVTGGIRLNGMNRLGDAPTLCGSSVSGGITMANATTAGTFVGDPEDVPPGSTANCPGNTITGGLTFSNVQGGSIEGNSITGGVTLAASSVEFNGNTISGTASCTNGTIIVPGEPPDPSTSNTC